MNREITDAIGVFCWYMMFFTPIITVPLVWKYSKRRPGGKIFIGLLFAVALSFILFIVSLSILFRDGLGPT